MAAQRVLASVLASLMLILAIPSLSVASSVSELVGSSDNTVAGRACEEHAKTAVGPWICVNGLAITGTSENLLVEDSERSRVGVDSKRTTSSAAQGNCQTSLVCRRKISSYIAETSVKGVTFWGAKQIGSWTVKVRQNLNGRQENVDVSFVWNSGPSISQIYVTRECKEHISFWPDNDCGIQLALKNKSVTSKATTTTGTIYGYRLVNSGQYYYDVIYGSFVLAGYKYIFTVPDFETLRWNCPKSGNCKFP